MLRTGILLILLFALFPTVNIKAQSKEAGILNLSMQEYEDKAHAIWIAQMIAVIISWPHEHQTASVQWLNKFPKPRTQAPVDDDWYYEMIALGAFEKYGVNLNLEQLGKEWHRHEAGYWGSSEQSRILLQKGMTASQAGHPRYNKNWFTIGPQFSAEVYGALAPGMPNLAGKIARELCHINGYAEGADGGVFVAAMVSLGFSEKDPKNIVRKAAQLIDPQSPYRQCLDLVINLAENGKTPEQIFEAVEDRWHIEYPATNNAVSNGGIVATSLWFGEGDFLKTVNLAAGAADFTDADCNAANAAAVVAAMHGLKAIPADLVKSLNDRIKAANIGKYTLKYAVDEKISNLARRTVMMGKKILENNGVEFKADMLSIPLQQPVTQPAELFKLADYTKYWNPEWKLERAGFGGTNSALKGLKGITYLDNDVLVTYPRDEVRGLFLHKTLTINAEKELSFDVAADSAKAWELNVLINNKKLLVQIIEGSKAGKKWEHIKINLIPYKGQAVKIRLYQRVLVPGKEAGNAYWKNILIQ